MFGRSKKPTAYEIGLNGTVEKLRAANEEMASRVKKHGYNKGDYIGQWDQSNLRAGAAQAFQEGRPENIQTILANTQEFASIGILGSRTPLRPEGILSMLLKDSMDVVATIGLAMEKIPEEKRQFFLNQCLLDASSGDNGTEQFISALLKSGAQAGLGITTGFKSVTLANAVESNKPLSVVKLLHENGAKFDDALFYMRATKKEEKDISGLEAYREKLEGAPPAAPLASRPAPAAIEDLDVRDILLLMQEQMATLTTRVEELTEEVRSQKPAPEEKPKPARKPYPSL